MDTRDFNFYNIVFAYQSIIGQWTINIVMTNACLVGILHYNNYVTY